MLMNASETVRQYAELVGINPDNFLMQMANTIVLFLLLRHFLFKPVTEHMANRTKKIEGNIQDADRLKKEAQDLKADYEHKIAQIKEEGQELIREATRNANAKRDEIIKEANGEAKSIIDRAELEAKRSMDKALDEYKKEIVAMTLHTTERFIDVKLDDQGHEKLINDFLGDLEDRTWQN
jgi:F-type H+-transporting ATPase subunit b